MNSLDRSWLPEEFDTATFTAEEDPAWLLSALKDFLG